MNVAILGTGSIGLANAALLADAGHHVTVWSPSGHGTAALGEHFTLAFSGAANGQATVHVARDVAAAIAGAPTVIIAVPAYGHAAVMNACAPHLTAAHVVFVDAFPMTESGKIRKAALREDASKRFGGSV